MNDDDLSNLRQARERVVPEHHHHDTLARAIEHWWGVTDGDEVLKSYGLEAVQAAHDKMQGFSPEQLDSIRNLGGYFRRIAAKSQPASGAQLLGRTAPHMKRKRDAEQREATAEQRALERRAAAAEIPGTLEHRIKYGSANNGE
jgi:hypothetical protein